MKRAAVRNAESKPSVIFQSDNAHEEEGSRHPQRRSGNEHSRSIWTRGGIHGCELDDWPAVGTRAPGSVQTKNSVQ